MSQSGRLWTLVSKGFKRLVGSQFWPLLKRGKFEKRPGVQTPPARNGQVAPLEGGAWGRMCNGGRRGHAGSGRRGRTYYATPSVLETDMPALAGLGWKVPVKHRGTRAPVPGSHPGSACGRGAFAPRRPCAFSHGWMLRQWATAFGGVVYRFGWFLITVFCTARLALRRCPKPCGDGAPWLKAVSFLSISGVQALPMLTAPAPVNGCRSRKAQQSNACTLSFLSSLLR